MFRATPEITEKVNVESDDEDKINFTLSKWDSIPTTEGQKKVKDLQEGDIVVLHATDALVSHGVIEKIQLHRDEASMIIKPQEGG